MPPKKGTKKPAAASAESKASAKETVPKAPAKKAAAKAAPKKVAEPVVAPVAPVKPTIEAPVVEEAKQQPPAQMQQQIAVETKTDQAQEAPKVSLEITPPQEKPALDMAKNVSELTMAEKKKLRMMRFNSGSMDAAATNTADALEQLQEQKEKIRARAERFGVVTKEMASEKIKNRQERFGIETKESKHDKIQQRKARFAAGGGGQVEATNDPELAKKLEERAKRFGAMEPEEKEAKSFRRNKFNKHKGEHQQHLGKRKRSNSGNKFQGGNKRFKKHH